MWHIPPDLKMLKRLKSQMAEVRSKMSDVKNQLSEVRGGGHGGAPSDGPAAPGEPGSGLAACGTESYCKLQELGRELLAKSALPGCYVRSATNKKSHATKAGRNGMPGSLSLRRAMDCGDGHLRLKGDAQVTSEGCLGGSQASIAWHGSPRAFANANASEPPPKPEEGPCEPSDAPTGALGLNGANAGEKANKLPAPVGPNPHRCRAGATEGADSENNTEAGKLPAVLCDGASAGLEEAGLCPKHALHLLPGMSSDSDVECDTETEEPEEEAEEEEEEVEATAAARDPFGAAFDAQPSSDAPELCSSFPDGDRLASGSFSFAPGTDGMR